MRDVYDSITQVHRGRHIPAFAFGGWEETDPGWSPPRVNRAVRTNKPGVSVMWDAGVELSLRNAVHKVIERGREDVGRLHYKRPVKAPIKQNLQRWSVPWFAHNRWRYRQIRKETRG